MWESDTVSWTNSKSRCPGPSDTNTFLKIALVLLQTGAVLSVLDVYTTSIVKTTIAQETKIEKNEKN